MVDHGGLVNGESIVVSVVVPAYNAARTLPDQLAALEHQDFDGVWEVLVVNNRSVDHTREVAGPFLEKLPLRVLEATERQGAAHARNVGVLEALGDYVAFCDADDVVAVDWLSQLVNSSSGDAVVAGTIDQDTELNSLTVRRARHATRVEYPMGPASLGPVAWGSNMLVPRELLIRIGLFDESLGAGEDAELCYRAFDSGATLVSAPSAVVSYRLRDSPRAVYRQARLWAYWDLEFYRRYRSRGATKRSTRSMIRSVWWIASRSPFIFRNPERRIQWFEKLGTLIGHTRECLAPALSRNRFPGHSSAYSRFSLIAESANAALLSYGRVPDL